MPDSRLHIQYESLEKQSHAAHLGMWLFLASEVLLFSTLFTLYASYRVAYTSTFQEAAHHTSLWLATAMTAVLLTSSLEVARSVGAIRKGEAGAAARRLVVAIALGVVFLVLKGTEYAQHFREGLLPGAYYSFEELTAPGVEVFFTLYYLMTGLHALHVAGGLLLLGISLILLRRGRLDERYHTPLELSGLYWHLVDGIWLFLWPIFYLMR